MANSTPSTQKTRVHVAGRGAAGVIAAYAAALCDDIHEVSVIQPPRSHNGVAAPQFLNVLRVCDVPDALGLVAPRPLMLVSDDRKVFDKTARIYAAAGAAQRLTLKE